jgi:endothelin-converting enzyme/putative endopeptidase
MFNLSSARSCSKFSTSILLLLALGSTAAQNPASTAPVGGPRANPAYMDKSVLPGNDFYQFASGNWEKDAVIPADRTGVSPATPVFDGHIKRMVDLIQSANGAPGTGAAKVVDLFSSYMDEAAIEAQGLAPLQPHLKAIAAIKDKHDLARALGETLRADTDALNNTNFHTPNLFGLWVAPGFSDPVHYTGYLMQGGLVMPDREYYLSNPDAMKDTREKYRAHIAAMLKLAGYDDTATRAERILALEHAIAEKHWSLADDNDVHKANNPWKASEFAAKAPGLDWAAYFSAAGLSNQKDFIVWQTSAISGESALVASEPLESWKDWLAFHLIETYGSLLPKAFADESFEFYGKTIGGATAQLPRSWRGFFLVDELLGDEVGQIYARRYFPPEVKTHVQAMVAHLIAVYHKRIQALTWLTPSTKAEALAKLDSLYVGVGYGETWHSYSNYEVKAGDLFGNVWRGRFSEYQRRIALLGTTVDRKEWSMTAQTIDAVNLPLQNALSFPAGILQPPFFDPNAPDAANYGSIGAVIGHEISHTFDSEGSAFDAQGRLRNWWTPEDFAHFAAETAKLVAQYDSYKPFPDLAINGKQTLSENLADDAGLAAAYQAYKDSLGGKPAQATDGFSGDQEFYLAFAQSWAGKSRPAALRNQVMTDTHSPGHYRALTVRNQDSWYSAFDVKPGQTLYLDPKDRVQIW